MAVVAKNCILNSRTAEKQQICQKCPKCGHSNGGLFWIPILPHGNEWKKLDCRCSYCGEKFEMSVVF